MVLSVKSAGNEVRKIHPLFFLPQNSMHNINNIIRIFYGTQRRLYLISVVRVLKIQPCEQKRKLGLGAGSSTMGVIVVVSEFFVGRENAFSRDSTASHRSSVPPCESPSSPGEGPPQTPPRSGRPPGVADGLPGPPHARASGSRSHLRCHQFPRVGLQTQRTGLSQGDPPLAASRAPKFRLRLQPGNPPLTPHTPVSATAKVSCFCMSLV